MSIFKGLMGARPMNNGVASAPRPGMLQPGDQAARAAGGTPVRDRMKAAGMVPNQGRQLLDAFRAKRDERKALRKASGLGNRFAPRFGAPRNDIPNPGTNVITG